MFRIQSRSRTSSESAPTTASPLSPTPGVLSRTSSRSVWIAAKAEPPKSAATTSAAWKSSVLSWITSAVEARPSPARRAIRAGSWVAVNGWTLSRRFSSSPRPAIVSANASIDEAVDQVGSQARVGRSGSPPRRATVSRRDLVRRKKPSKRG